MLARQAGLEIWRRFGIPVYFYEAAAARPDRINLEDIRRGQFEGLRETSQRDASRRPDVGGPEIHRTAGATAVGARRFLIAYNIYLDSPQGTAAGGLPQAAQANIAAARAIARSIRASGGGMHGVKALGVSVNGRAQVSMNITDFRATPVRQIHAAVRELALNYGRTSRTQSGCARSRASTPKPRCWKRGCSTPCRGQATRESWEKILRIEQKLRIQPNLRTFRSSKPQVPLASGGISGKNGMLQEPRANRGRTSGACFTGVYIAQFS
jgi:hypothetical protein